MMEGILRKCGKSALAAVGLLLLETSCGGEEGADIWPDDGSIRFTTEKVTKGAINGAADFTEGTAFGVFGAYSSDGTGFTGQVPVFGNVPVTKAGSFWTYQNTAYWFDGMHYRFRAFYPYADQNAGDPGYMLVNSFGATDTYTITNFFVKDKVEEQVDLLVSDVVSRNLANQSDKSPVAFTFHHMLSKINVKIRRSSGFGLDKRIIRITARLYGMKKKGNCVAGVWNTLPSDVNTIGFTSSFQDKNGLLKEDNAELSLWNDGLLLIPQHVAGVKLEVEFVVEHWDGADPPELTKTTTETQLMTLPTETLWKNASQITYTAQIESNSHIVFLSPKVEPWVESGSSNSIIIK